MEYGVSKCGWSSDGPCGHLHGKRGGWVIWSKERTPADEECRHFFSVQAATRAARAAETEAAARAWGETCAVADDTDEA